MHRTRGAVVEVVDDDDSGMLVEEDGPRSLVPLALEPLSQEHRQMTSAAHQQQPGGADQPLWEHRRRTTFEDRSSLRRTQALRALRTQLIPSDQLRYRAADTLNLASSSSSSHSYDQELAQLNPRDMTDDQLVRWRKLQHDDQWNQYAQVHRDRCNADFLYHFMFSDIREDRAARCLRYFRLVSAVENLVIGRYGAHLANDVIARWRWYAIPPNWSPRAWSAAVQRARAEATDTSQHALDQAMDHLIDSWMRNPATAPSVPSYTKKKCEEWLLLTLIVHVPEFSAYILADPTTASHNNSAKAPLLVDRVGASMLLLTGDGRQMNRPGQPLRFWSIAQLWMRAAHGQPMDPSIPPLSHTNCSILGFTEPSPDVFCGPFTPFIATTMAPHEHNMAVTPFAVVRYFIEQYPLVTRVLAPPAARVTAATGSWINRPPVRAIGGGVAAPTHVPPPHPRG